MPAVGSFNDPAAGSKARVGLAFLFFLSARLDMGDVSAPRSRATQLRIIVAFVAAQVLPTPFLGRRAWNHQRVQRGLELLHVVAIRARYRDCQRDAIGIREIVPLGAQFAAIGGVFSDLIPPLTGAETVAESIDWKSQSIPWRSS